jgi:hypothetical protein
MRPKKSSDTWLTKEAFELLDEFWCERVINILQDLSELPHLRYAYAVSLGGTRLSAAIGPGAKPLKDDPTGPEAFHHLAEVVEEYLERIGQPAPAHVTVELADEMLFVGSTGKLILVASFDGQAARGYVGMKLAKRISHMRNIFKASQQKGGTRA